MQRITFGQTAANIQQYINLNGFKMDQLQQQLSSGRKLMKPSDDPIGVSNALDLRTTLAQNGQYERNVDSGVAYLGTVDTTLSGNNDLIQHARDLAIQGASDTLTSTDRGYIANEARSVLDQMVAVANTSFRGDYVFSGTNTQLPPYEVRDGSATLTGADVTAGTVGQPLQIVDLNVSDSKDTAAGNANAYNIIPGTFAINGLKEGTDYTVDYVNGTVTFTPPGTAALALVGAGNMHVGFSWVRRNEGDLDGVVNREVSQNQLVQTNTTASDAYGSNRQTSSFAAMIKLLEGLTTNKGATVSQSVGMLDTAVSRNLAAQSANGARMNEYTSAQDRSKTKDIDLTDLQSKIEDVDFSQAITQLSMQQAVYEASLKMGAASIQKTLMDFM